MGRVECRARREGNKGLMQPASRAIRARGTTLTQRTSMSDQPPEWARNLEKAAIEAARAVERAGRALGKAVEQAGRTAKAQAAMAAAYQADLEALEKVLRELPAEQVRDISAAAAVVTATADRVLSQTPKDDL
ncbi:hypothetical protein GCM10027161_08940 [Microbispora hainanensis]